MIRGSVWKRKITRKIMDQEKDKIISIFTVKDLSHDDDDAAAAAASTVVKDTNRKEKIRYGLVSYDELPDYMKDNEYILNYYRANWPLKLAFRSLFQWHNETLNVWTHALGFVLFVGLTVANVTHVPQLADFITMFTAQYPPNPEANVLNKSSMGPPKLIDLKQEATLIKADAYSTTTPNWPLYVFLSGSMFCLLSSSLCHLLCCHSKRLNSHLLRMDYAGISVMIITSFFPPIYYIFLCTPHWQIIYLTIITIMGACTIITFLSPTLSSGKCRSFRVSLFLCMGLFGLVPAVHALVANWDDPYRNVTLAYESVMALSYLVGTVFYVTRVPERWGPGWFDLAGHSHQIFHVFVVMGALAHYGAAHIFLRHRSKIGCDTIA